MTQLDGMITKNRSSSIDTLRFIAAGIVCLAHAIPVANLHFIVPEFTLGRVGVVIFFMISGYLIPVSLNAKNGGLLGFWISRFFRLYPMYWVSIALAIFILNKKNLIDIAFNITMFQALFGVKDMIGVYWTLIIEMLFYIYCSVMFFFGLLGTRKYVLASYFLMILTALLFSAVKFTLNKNLPVAIPLLFSVMFIGYTIKLNERGITSKKDITALIVSFIALIPFISYLGYSDDKTASPELYIISYIVGVVLFILLFRVNITNKITPRLGEISYSTYLIHPVVMSIVFSSTAIAHIDKWILFIAYMGIVYFMSEVFFRYIEIPFISLGKKVKKLSQRGVVMQ
ncbi:acyltransferase [Klebsiella pasteurii]|uniref:acyltransferase family protein n=2 Tax=Klebsiella TaxID=570 RepID=UPI002245EDE0|nr:acyltransferase [Klebsiella pasteurii]MCW9586513.1 acyltransferase [Klebsiella pasteurii]